MTNCKIVSTSSTHSFYIFAISTNNTIILYCVGVTDINTNVEAKTVIVTHSDAVSKESMLEKLQKVNKYSWICVINFLLHVGSSDLMIVFDTMYLFCSGHKQAENLLRWLHKWR